MNGDIRFIVQVICVILFTPTYFTVLFISTNAPNFSLWIPTFAKKKLKKSDGPLGLEICPSLRLLSPHNWPHPIYTLPYIILLYRFRHVIPIFCISQLLGIFFLMIEKREYLKAINELPEQGFCRPDPPGIVHGTRSLLYNLYLKFFVRANVLCFKPLAQLNNARTFLKSKLPPRLDERPAVIRGLPQRQLGQLLPKELSTTKDERIFSWFEAKVSGVEAKVSINEGAGARGLYSSKCKCLGTEFAHEHKVDGSWHCVLSPQDALEVCTLGWGERGPPIVIRNMWQNFPFAPDGWVFLYAPRTEEDLKILRTILEAAYSFTTV